MTWDENDYSQQPLTNPVVTMVDTNYGFRQLPSNVFYDHFSLLRRLEGGFRLPCLNHACDANRQAITDLFGQPETGKLRGVIRDRAQRRSRSGAA